jgi:predicted GNAT superfamily acetyltransferase
MSKEAISIRDIDSVAELRVVEELQREVWGIPDIEVVPLSQLVAAKASGGVLVGAFDGEDLVGFAYGFVGYERGTVVHHLHMLAVKPAYRAHDLGFRLKAAQRERVMQQGIEVMTWTFDPLQSLNAHFNIAKLGVISDKYLIDFYGDEAASFLHRNGTDRLWVSWLLTNSRVVERLAKVSPTTERSSLQVLVKSEGGHPQLNAFDDASSNDRLSIEIPADINAIEKNDAGLAAEWRSSTRQAFTTAINSGFIVEDFFRSDRSGDPIGVYVLSRGKVLTK